MTLEVLDVDGLATIQDSGRTGWRKFGVPASGAMDAFAFHAANRLAGNDPNCAAIEIGLGDITFRARRDCVIAVAGVGFGVSVYIWDFPLWSSYYVRGGWTVRLAKQDAGTWAYVAVSGGVQTPPTLGSSSTYLRGPFGGFDGRPLQAGDVLRSGTPSRSLNNLAARTLPESARPHYGDNPILDVIMGPQEQYFTEESIETFLSSAYMVSPTSDRMGYRLEGVALTHRGSTELLSEGMTMGTIQVPASGQPIVMMADSPTTGGYPKIGTVASADLPLLAQCTPGKSAVRFRKTTVARAQKKFRELMRGLEMVVEE
jgi:antagonist of KipI